LGDVGGAEPASVVEHRVEDLLLGGGRAGQDGQHLDDCRQLRARAGLRIGEGCRPGAVRVGVVVHVGLPSRGSTAE
jgi:hypothetical protein